MKLVKILASVVFSVIIIIAIAGYFAVRHFDLNKYKSYASEIVEKQLGRKLVINGDASIGISLVPTIVVNDIELSNPSWASSPQMLKLKQAEVKFALLPLLKKQIVIDKIALVEPQVYLEKNAAGNASWNFKGATETPQAAVKGIQKAEASVPAVENNPAAVLLAGFAARNVSVENGLIEYYDAKANSRINAQINSIVLEVPSFNDKINVAFDVVYDGQKATGKAELGSLNTLTGNKEPFPFVLTAKVLGIQLEANGSFADALSAPRYAAAVNIYNPAGNLNAPETTFKARIDGDVNEAAALIETLNVVNNLVTGNVKVNWSGTRPDIVADLQSAKIDLQNFSQNSNFALKLPSLISEAQALEVVPDTVIPYAALQTVNAKANVKIGQLIAAPGMQADNVSAAAVLNNGVLTVNPLTLDFGGGSLNASLSANAVAQSMTLKAVSQNMTLQNVHQEFKVSGNNDFGIVSGGKFDLDVNMGGNGATWRQLVQNMKGTAIVIVDQSVLQTGGLKYLTGNFVTQLLTALNIDTKKSKEIDLNCAVVRADVSGGKAVFPQGIALSSKQLALVSDGSINLLNDQINFTIQPSMNKLADANITQALASFIKVAGTLNEPKIRLDDKEAIKTIIGVAATGGTAYLGSQVLLDGSSSPCYTALQGTAYASRFPKPTGVKAETQNVYQDATKQINKDIKDLKNAAKGLLKSLKTSK